MTTKQDLLDIFEHAISMEYDAVGVNLEVEGHKETIIVPFESMTFKKEFYKKAYDQELHHVMNKKVSITNVFSIEELPENIMV